MNNPFPLSDDNKRYHTFNYFLRHNFGSKVFKVSLNAGFTCPNIDGTKGFGGCTYCSDSGSGDFAGNPKDNILKQFYEVKNMMHHKWHDAKYIGYFQAHTNTYAPLQQLQAVYEPILDEENVVGLSIATRADCISDEVLDYLEEINKRTFLMVELGLQSVNDETGNRINRCHTYNDFLDGYNRLRQRGIRVCVHVINGLPNETKEDMLNTVKTISQLDIFSIKIHLLHVIKGTVIEKQFLNGDFSELSLEDYVQIVCDQLELLPKEVVVQRVTGDGNKETLVSPLWSLKKFVVMNEIDKEMVRRNSYQGIKYKKL
ncbi:MAG: TIGR01212 family radical SAM protein [Oscillospiraceae bacterium]